MAEKNSVPQPFPSSVHNADGCFNCGEELLTDDLFCSQECEDDWDAFAVKAGLRNA